MKIQVLWCAAVVGVVVAASVESRADAFAVIATSPVAATTSNSVHSAISVTFDKPVLQSSITADNRRFWVRGRWSGPVTGVYVFTDDDKTVTLVPDDPFFAGEDVSVILSHDIEATDGSHLRSAGYSFCFWTHARRAPIVFKTIDTLSCRDESNRHTQAYGGVAADLNHDRWTDLAVVQEVTADIRVFLNRADNSGLFHPLMEPTAAVGNRASPSETADFNGDGHVDICVANIDDNTVSILLGRGDGTFDPQIVINVGVAPRGIAVLDYDGDGDQDIANTNSISGNISLITNFGGGNFDATPSFFDPGGIGEWSLAAADMNHDGITDLVCGARSSQRMIVLLGNGDGTFTFASSTPCGGRTWMIAIGDVNGDGHKDVATANSSSNNAAIMLGDGLGGLGAATTYPVGSFPLATDLGDIDGDGDLDWTTSSFSAAQWQVFTNDGSGVFTTHEIVNAPAAGSCTILHDFDNDGDLDISLIDELADVVLLRENSGKAIFGDFEGDGDVDRFDFAAFLDCVGPAPVLPDCEVFDSDGDRDVDFADFAAVQIAFTG
ncbi:MAG: VCBS repeat-containing protein [Planctomycetes bacterium]|nr:VCBS repeat-containing protein [Planctomycetota bacterium]